MALVLIARRKERGVRAAVPEGHPEPLRVADGDVGAPFPWGREQGECQQIGRGGHQRARVVRGLAQ